MAWTTPRTWVPGEFVTSAMLNTHIRDNENVLYGAFQSQVNFTTQWLGSIANPTLGNGTLTASYAKVGPLYFVSIILGIGSTTGVGNGNWYFSLPTTPILSSSNGRMLVLQSGVQWFDATVLYAGAGPLPQIYGMTFASGGTVVGASYPTTWKSGDQLSLSMIYSGPSGL